jgi:AcrR family transcriptional regulator
MRAVLQNTASQQASEPESGLLPEAMADKIMDACLHVIAEQGIAAFKIIDVVNHSGISRQSVYNHFRNKNELLDATIAREVLRISELSAVEMNKHSSLEDKFVAGFLCVYQNFPANPLLKEVIDNYADFISNVNARDFSVEAFGRLCLHPVFEQYPMLASDIKEITEYWSRSILSMLMLPLAQNSNLKEIEAYVRKRLLPGLRLDTLVW